MINNSLTAKWIWKRQKQYNVYNQTIVARKFFQLIPAKKAMLCITADSFYRLFINDQWVNDGPCRSWPENYQYDVIDVTPYLCAGPNKINVISKYYGVGTIQQICQQAGLFVQIDIDFIKGGKKRIISDRSWEIAAAKGWVQNTPKITINLGPLEYYDARLESRLQFTKAEELYHANCGPWKNLHPRDTALLTHKPYSLHSFLCAHIVEKEWIDFCIPTARLCHPGMIEANHGVSQASLTATIIEATYKRTIQLDSYGYTIIVNGKAGRNGRYNLLPGRNFLLAAVSDAFGHHNKERNITFMDTKGFKLINPLYENYENPWCFIPLQEKNYVSNDIISPYRNACGKTKIKRRISIKINRLLKQVADINGFNKYLKKKAKKFPSRKMLMKDIHRQFMYRRVIKNAKDLIINPTGLMYDNGEYTAVKPSYNGDIELVYDLGQQDIGYYDIELISESGVQVDIFGIEYIAKNGKVQHTRFMRNGMRYITKQGLNRFVSLERRSGRYLFITFRKMNQPVRIRKIQLIESTYPVNYSGSFQCSDYGLNKIWEISAHTLKLCMEDTFTDCPLYEQTLWVGDLRNEALFAYGIFGATDLAKSSLTLAGQSLERFPLIGSQVPSAWECLLPAWSFLWVIAVWDYYFYTGDIVFLRKAWRWVVENLKNAEKMRVDNGLFCGPYWNMFDWAKIDDSHKTVLHNSMFLAGAIKAAVNCAKVLKDNKSLAWLKIYSNSLVKDINKFWDEKKKAYPDSIHNDGKISNSTSQHTSFLSVLYDIIEDKNINEAINNITNPVSEMTKVGSPFALLYLYEAFEKIGLLDEIIKSIYVNYLPMIDSEATTVWETFSTGTLASADFPTRSHAHGWSSVPVYFLNRIILGIRQTAAGGKSFEISPRLNGLAWAKGSNATVNGPVEVEWSVKDKILNVTIKTPKGVKWRFIKNDTHKGLRIVLNGRRRV